MKGASWEVERTEGPLVMVVERRYLNCGGSGYKFSIYNSGCEEKYPMLRSNDLCEDSEYDSEEEQEKIARSRNSVFSDYGWDDDNLDDDFDYEDDLDYDSDWP